MVLIAALGLAACGGEPSMPDAEADGGVDAGPALCASAAECSDELFCNGAERCAPDDSDADERGCAPAASPACLASQTCDEDEGACLSDCEAEPDTDGDGRSAIACGGDDCDDADATRYPGAVELCDLGQVDEDCNPATFGFIDLDGDGVPSDTCCNDQGDETVLCGRDCDDMSPTVSPTNTETCDGVDNDCDIAIDEAVTVVCYDDGDDDGYAAVGASTSTHCSCPSMTTTAAPEGDDVDCDDAASSRSPVGVEVCNDVDDDCDDDADEGLALVTRYVDLDGDGRRGEPVLRCEGDPGSQSADDDCDEASTTVYVGAPELCDRIDNNCSSGGGVDAGEDVDGDGYAPLAATCTGGSLESGDCDDASTLANPGAAEQCDAADNDCNGTIDDRAAVDALCDADVANGEAICLGGACVLASCDVGFDDCDRDGLFVSAPPGTLGGCEAYLDTDGSHCGACGRACPGPCVDGACTEVAEAMVVGQLTSGVVSSSGSLYTCGFTLEDGHSGSAIYTVPTDVPVPGAVSQATGAGCALIAGAVYCWGDNGFGQLGNGLTGPNDGPVPAPVPGLANIAMVAHGTRHVCAVHASGAMSCWGSNSDGQLGAGPAPSVCAFVPCSRLPMSVLDVTDAVEAAVGEGFTCARHTNGDVSCWGANGQQQLGGATVERSPGKYRVNLAPAAVEIVAGEEHACARTTANDVYCWGANQHGNLGNAETDPNRATPELVLGGAVALGAFADSTCAVLATGVVRCWGYNANAQLGNGALASRSTPVPVARVTDAVDVALGLRHGCALRGNGSMACWSNRNDGFLGDGTLVPHVRPALVHGFNEPATMLAGEYTNCGIRTTGETECWGRPEYAGGLFDGTPYRHAEIGWRHTCAVLADGTVRCAGEGAVGQLGDGNTADNLSSFVVATGLTDAVAVDLGVVGSCALRVGGLVSCWGRDVAGNVAASDSLVPLEVPVTEVVQISAGQSYCARHMDGRVSCWADRRFGTAVTVIPGLRGTRDVSAAPSGSSGGHVCVVTNDGGVVCWGFNTEGQLGRGAPSAPAGPGPVSGLSGVVDVETGTDHSCALTEDGDVYCWGENGDGQLGIGTVVDAQTPQLFPTGGVAARAVFTAARATCVLLESRTVLCSGSNQFRSLVDTATTQYESPIEIAWW